MKPRKSRRTKYIEGIFNYCDRWCERCSMKQRCALYAQEARVRERHFSKNEDPNDLETAMQDVRKSLRRTMRLIRKKAEEEGIDLSAGMEEAEAEIRSSHEFRRKHPLHKQAMRLANQSHRFLETLAREIQSETFRGADTGVMERVQDCFEVLSWYHMQQAVKIDRALGSLRERSIGAGERDVLYDANGSAKIAHLGLVRMLDSYTKLHEWNSSWNAALMPLIYTTCEIIEEVDRLFPGHKKFKRPGFDD